MNMENWLKIYCADWRALSGVISDAFEEPTMRGRRVSTARVIEVFRDETECARIAGEVTEIHLQHEVAVKAAKSVIIEADAKRDKALKALAQTIREYRRPEHVVAHDQKD